MKQLLLVIGLCVASCFGAIAQQTVTGVVVDGRNEPVPGVRVSVDGRTESCVTDIDGRYVLEIAGPAKKLIFTYVGYKPIERRIKPEQPDMLVRLGSGWGARPRGYRGFFDFYGGMGGGGQIDVIAGNNAITNIGNTTMQFGFALTQGYQINEHLFAGLGLGITAFGAYANEKYSYNYTEWGGVDDYRTLGFSHFNFPVYADVRWDFNLAMKAQPYVGLKIGYQFSVSPDYEDSVFGSYYGSNGYYAHMDVYGEDARGLFLMPSIGMRTSMGGKRGFNIGLSYNLTVPRTYRARYTTINYGGDDYTWDEQEMTLKKACGGVLMFNFGFDF